MANQFKRNICLRDQLAKAYLCVGLLIFSSIIVFYLSSLLVPQKLINFAGPGILISRACAIVICVFTTLSVMCISRDLNTCLRKGCCGRRCQALLDQHIMYHKVCGYIAIVYSLLHTIGHLFGGVNALANSESVDQINDVLTHKKFQRKLSYLQIAFTTLPGITGAILLKVALFLWISSLPCIRRRKWEVFSFTHLLYYLFIIGMVVHGADTWLNPGFPLSFPFSAVSLAFIFFTLIRRQLQAKTQPCQIEEVLTAPDLSFVFLKIKRSPGLVVEPGQYMLLNLPHYSKFQWHAYSVCSGREDSTVNFIIKNNGNFSRFLIYFFKEGWKKRNEDFSSIPKNKKKKLAIVQPESKLDFVKPSFRRYKDIPNLKAYKLNLSGPFGAPCQSAAYKEHIVLIGAGIGITPYLAFLRTLPPQIKSINFVFICREPELMRWISLSLHELNFSIEQQKRIKISLYLTRRKETHCLSSFLFWRAFLALKKKQEQYGSTRDMLLDAPMTVSYKRPNLKQILRDEGNSLLKGTIISVYSCAPHQLNERLRGICKEASKEMQIRYDFYPEIFS